MKKILLVALISMGLSGCYYNPYGAYTGYQIGSIYDQNQQANLDRSRAQYNQTMSDHWARQERYNRSVELNNQNQLLNF